MATLFNTKIKDTYQSLLKLEDNTILTTTSKNITDGLGNASPLYLSTTRVGIGTNAPTTSLTIYGGSDTLGITGPVNQAKSIQIARYNSSDPLAHYIGDDGNAFFGSGLTISASGTNSQLYLQVASSGRNVNIGTAGQTLLSKDMGARLGVRGSGSTSATTSFLVQNSSGTNALQVTDDGNTFFYTASGATVRIGDSTTSIFRIVNTWERINISPVSFGGTITLNAGTEAGASYTANDSGHVFAYPFNRTTANTFSINRQFYGNVIAGTKTMLNITTSNITGLSNATTLRGIYFAPTITDWGSVVAFESTAGNVIFNGGNVGIGTSSPTNPLDIAFTPGRFISFQAVPGYADSGQIVFSNATSAGIVSSGTIAFGPGDTNKSVFLGNGLVSKITTPGSTKYDGYGNQTPSTLAGTTNRPFLFTSTIPDGNIDGFIFENTSSGSRNLFKVIQNNTTLLTLNPNGNLMLGTTTDNGYKLDVNGTARVNGVLTVGSVPITGTYGQMNFTNNGVGGVAVSFNGQLGLPDPTCFGNQGLHAHSSSQVEIKSTTKGFLPPRMTNAQRAAITAPAIGLMVYCTDSVEGLYIYKSTGWTFIA